MSQKASVQDSSHAQQLLEVDEEHPGYSTERDGALPFRPLQLPVYPSQMDGTQFDKQYPIPREFRIPSGSTVVEPDSVVDDSGMSFHGYKQGKYLLPNDAVEQERLDVQHMAMVLLLDGRLAMAPMTEPPKNVIDIATGTGIWAVQFGEQNPTSHIIGTDLSKIQPSNHPPNCEFIKEDSEEPWVYPNVPSFDYIHLRFVCTCFDSHKEVLRQAVENLTPGTGWIEYQDFLPEAASFDGSHVGTTMEKYFQLCRAGLALKGRELLAGKYYKEWLIEAGLVDVTEMTFAMPCNTWPGDTKHKRIGQYMILDIEGGGRGFAWQMLRSLGMEPAEIDAMMLEFKSQFRDENYRWFMPVKIVYGRKPFDWEVKKRQDETNESTKTPGDAKKE